MRGSDSETLSGTPYDASDQITANTPAGTQKADPDKPLEVSVKGNDARITDVTATDTTGRFVRGELSADGRHWRTTAPLAAGSRYTVRVSTEEEDGSPGRKTLVVNTRGADGQLTAAFGPKEGSTASASRSPPN